MHELRAMERWDAVVQERRFETQHEDWDEPKYRRAFSKVMGRFLYFGLAISALTVIVCIVALFFVEA